MDGYGRHNGPINNLDGWNNPETDRRGVQSFQGDHPLPSEEQYLVATSNQSIFPASWNTPESDHCGDRFLQGDHASRSVKRKQKTIDSNAGCSPIIERKQKNN